MFQPKTGVFSGFGGFNKTQPSSFDFLANLTNGNKTNSSPKSKSDTAVTSSLFSSKPPSSSPNIGLFGQPQVSSSPASKSPFSGSTSQPSSLFGGSTTNTQAVTSLFTASKADSTVGDSPFKNQPISSSNDSIGADSAKTTNALSNSSGSQVTSTIFGAPSTSANANKGLFSNTNTTPFKIQPVSSSTAVQSAFGTTSTIATSKSNENQKETKKDEKKMKYYGKLKGLNESVCDWIKKHVEETPLCILSPIFKDYEKYLKEMQDEYLESDDENETQNKTSNPENASGTKLSTASDTSSKSMSAFGGNNLTSSPFNKTETSPSSKLSTFGNATNGTSLGGEKSKFAFGVNSATPSGGGFSFGVSTTQTTTTTATSPFTATSNLSSATNPFSATSSLNTATSPFSATANLNSGTNNNSNGAAPFSFGLGKPFSFNSNIQKPATETTEEGKEEEDAPPKVEFTPIVEENSVFDKKCKVFVKKDGNFVDKGVGTLYIKKVEESGKHQLLVRANTNLGNVLVNLILASAIPTQRMGKNNVMMVCIPTPDAKPPPTPILIRVKTSEEADELLATLDKYKT